MVTCSKKDFLDMLMVSVCTKFQVSIVYRLGSVCDTDRHIYTYIDIQTGKYSKTPVASVTVIWKELDPSHIVFYKKYVWKKGLFRKSSMPSSFTIFWDVLKLNFFKILMRYVDDTFLVFSKITPIYPFLHPLDAGVGDFLLSLVFTGWERTLASPSTASTRNISENLHI